MSKAKVYRRRFRTCINLDLYTRFAQEVIDRIENDTINVFRPDDSGALDDVRDAGGAILLDARATLPVSVREWLPVVCQFIRWDDEYDRGRARDGADEKKVLAYYYNNAGEVLWPKGRDFTGPGALIAGVILRRERCIDDCAKDNVVQYDRLQFLLAHELVHAIHAMRFVVPAFMDWRTFQREVLRYGGCCDLLGSNHASRTGFLDHYGTELELAEVLRFWPSYGKRWFKACHGQVPGPAVRRRVVAGKVATRQT
jgi:hypothetical protein